MPMTSRNAAGYSILPEEHANSDQKKKIKNAEKNDAENIESKIDS